MKAFLDTETTGFLVDGAPLESQPKIIEIGLVICEDDYSNPKEVSQLINPGFQISEEIQKITGLLPSDLIGAPTFAKYLNELISHLFGVNTLYAHNLPFDRQMIVDELRRIDREFSFPYPPRQICTAVISEELYGKRMRLIELYERVIGRKLDQKHRALSDAIALYEVCKRLDL